MSYWQRITRSDFFIRLKSWEYWPFGIVHFPAILYWLWLSFRARSLVFFSASNPGIPMGGLFGESKFDILKKIPSQWVPATILIQIPVSPEEVMARIRDAEMKLPVIFKPDIGERGYMVQKITHEDEIVSYLREIRSAFLVQEHVNEPLEFGVFYLKFPADTCGRVISVVAKEMLSVTGNGVSTLQQLIFQNDRAKLQWRKLKIMYQRRLEEVPEAGEKIELVPIGNHARGARFINANHLINKRLSETFDTISSQIPGFYFGRFDLRCATLDDLYTGNVKFMELNGCGAEPAHIYDTEFPLWRAFYELVKHWHYIFRIARDNNKRGVDYVSHREAIAFYRKFKSAIK